MVVCWLLKHERSNEHQKAVAVKKAADNPSETRIVVSVLNMEKDLLERMEKLFNTAYLIAKKELSSETLGLLTKVGCSTGNTYHNDKACQQFLCQIDGVLFDDLVNLTFNFKMTLRKQCAALCAMNFHNGCHLICIK